VKTIILEAEFSSAHFYHQPLWTEDKNREVFGRCFTKFGHGHNYKLRAEWEDLDDAKILIARKKLDQIVAILDHEHLNFVIPEFKNKIPTTENILDYFRSKIESLIPFHLVNLELFETPEIGAKLNL
jgi:6-pyruvoyltetrahydropterin/6-carboxytetrahydropterin synthase